MTMRVGALALQGDFDAHLRVLDALGADTCAVRKPSQLDEIDALVMPGGESTTLIKLMDAFDFWEPLQAFARRGAVFGTCAGLIMAARRVVNPEQRSLGLIDVTVERNSYGRQKESFESTGAFDDGHISRQVPMIFIRAPRMVELGQGVQSLATHGHDVVMARSGRVLVASFHPELGGDRFVHEYFLGMAAETTAPA